MEMSDEIWKPLLRFGDKHEVSSLGRIRYIGTEHYLGGKNLNIDGYRVVKLGLKGKNVECRIARLVAKLFLPNPYNLPIVDHINGIRNDDTVSNLRWTTNEGNRHNRQVKKNKISSKLIGVYENNVERRLKIGKNKTPANSYRARINFGVEGNNRIVHLGTYRTDKEAGIARDVVALFRDSNARLNFPEEIAELFPKLLKFFISK